MNMTGSQVVVSSLQKEGVDLIFGYPGGVVLPLYDALYDFPIRHILTRHEQGAAHAADGYARVTGKVGVCIATSGPGATNLVTGIANANADSVPLVCITGQVGLAIIGKDSFQEADVTGITASITKHNYLVKNPLDLPRVMKEAFYIARTGRPGPVVVDIPKDVFTATIDYHYPEQVHLRGYKPLDEGKPAEVEQAAAALLAAKRPLLFIGGGVVSAGVAEEIVDLAETWQIPVITSLMGLGAVPAGHPLFLGMVGMHGTVAANLAVMDCDLLLGAGVRFDDRVTGLLSKFAPKAKIIHFDIDPAEINKNVPAHLRVVGHLGWSLPALRQVLRTNQPFGVSPERKEWIVQTGKWREDSPLVYQPDGQVIKPQYVIQELDRLTESKAILVTDVGQHQMWSAQFYRFNRPRTLVTSGGLGTMGFGLPAAMGAQFGRPDELVVLVTGDGSILMNCQEMATIVEHKLPIKVAIINNQVLGMVRQWQRLFYRQRYAYSGFAQGGTDYVRLAEAFGAVGLRATTPAEVPVVIEKALAVDGPVFMDFQVCPEENVLPMVPAGASLDQMIEGVID